eukprot:8991822-Pyramimonas_sp.AAC.1
MRLASQSPLGSALGGLLGRFGGLRSRVGVILCVFERSLADSQSSWTVVGASWGPPSPSWGPRGLDA